MFLELKKWGFFFTLKGPKILFLDPQTLFYLRKIDFWVVILLTFSHSDYDFETFFGKIG